MLTNLRWKLANKLAKRAAELSDRGGFKNVMKGMKYMKYSIMVVPPNKELHKFAEELRKTAEEHKSKMEQA